MWFLWDSGVKGKRSSHSRHGQAQGVPGRFKAPDFLDVRHYMGGRSSALWDSGIHILCIGCVVAKMYLCDIRVVGTARTIYFYNLSQSLALTKETLNQENPN
jgi:hypothetical protein